MIDLPDQPKLPDAASAAQIRAACARGAYSIQTLAALARVDPEVVTSLVNGATIIDVSARDRVMDVLGLRPDSVRQSASPPDRTLRASD